VARPVNDVVAIYLIIIGPVGLFGSDSLHPDVVSPRAPSKG
jgi:hypothetical protein